MTEAFVKFVYNLSAPPSGQPVTPNTVEMAPKLALATLQLICDMINSDEQLTTYQIADAAGCSDRSVKTIRLNIRLLGVREPHIFALAGDEVSHLQC
jgi:hypothetical protein